jgi:transcriptional regulator with XRE-family HTH domain
MKSTGKIIYEVRVKKGISQEELATLAKVNLRTIQRIENDLTEPRDTTINLICGVLEIHQDELKPPVIATNTGSLGQKLINAAFLVLLNCTIAYIVIYLTVYDVANSYTRVGAFFLCMILPTLIVWLTRTATGAVRLFKFGSGFMLLIIFLLFQVNIDKAVFSGAIPSSLIALAILFYGNLIPFKK